MNRSATTEIETREAHGTDAQWSPCIPVHSQWEVQVLRGVLRAKGLQRDWDSYGGPPPSAKAVDVCLRLVRQIAELDQGDLPVPHVAPVPGGGIQIEWRVGERELDLEILPDGVVEFLRAERGEPVDEAALGSGQLDSLLAWAVSTRRSG